MRHDIVYILKEDIGAEELRYSLRSVQANFPHRRVWFFCGCPDGITPDGYVRFKQTGRNKWQKSTSTFRKIAETDAVSDDFWLFNDDFFVMQKVIDLPYMIRGSLTDRVAGIREKRTVSGSGKVCSTEKTDCSCLNVWQRMIGYFRRTETCMQSGITSTTIRACHTSRPRKT